MIRWNLPLPPNAHTLKYLIFVHKYPDEDPDALVSMEAWESELWEHVVFLCQSLRGRAVVNYKKLARP